MTRTKLLIAAAALLVFNASSFGAAALAGGAKTSCKPTATNPALRQIQINADPLNVQSFALTMSYQNNLVTFSTQNGDVKGLNGFTIISTESMVVGNTTYTTVSGRSGNPLPGELDVFGIVFTLLPGLPLDQPLEFSVDALGTDTITAIDTDKGVTVDYSGDQVEPSFSGPVAILPEPSAMGLVGMGAAGMLARRRR